MRDFIIADNQEITRTGIGVLIERAALAAYTEICTDFRSLSRAIAGRPSGVVILDYALFDFYGVEQLLNLSSRYDRVSWLLFSDELHRQFIRQVVPRGMFSIVMKSASLGEISQAITDTAQYRTYLCESAARIMREEAPCGQAERLTPSEISILREIALGRTTKEIAAGRFLSFHTVNSHRKNIFRKLEVSNVQEAIRYALRAGVIDMADYNI